MSQIRSYAAYLPHNVLSRDAAARAWPRLGMAVDSKTVPSLDEDVITMAAEAAIRALARAGMDGATLGQVVVATTTSPYVVKSAAAVVADYVGAGAATRVVDLGAGTHAGLLALVHALQQPPGHGPTLVVGADAIVAHPTDASDLGYGAGAAAFVVADDGRASLEHTTHAYSSYANTWQPAGDTQLRRYDDDRFDRSAGFPAQMARSLQTLLDELDGKPDWYALQLTGRGSDQGVVSSLPASSTQVVGRELVQRIGDTGCANALLCLGQALDQAAPGDGVAVQAYGDGAGTIGALVRVTGSRVHGPMVDDTWSPIEIDYVTYAKHRRLIPLPSLPTLGSPFGASPAWERTRRATLGLRAARCQACGSLNFPGGAYCLDCRGQSFDDVALPRRATIATFNVQHVVSIGPEEAPLPICTAVLDGEPADRYGNKLAALITEADPDTIRVGLPVELVPRRGDVEDGLVSYGWKFRPVPGEG